MIHRVNELGASDGVPEYLDFEEIDDDDDTYQDHEDPNDPYYSDDYEPENIQDFANHDPYMDLITGVDENNIAANTTQNQNQN